VFFVLLNVVYFFVFVCVFLRFSCDLLLFDLLSFCFFFLCFCVFVIVSVFVCVLRFCVFCVFFGGLFVIFFCRGALHAPACVAGAGCLVLAAVRCFVI